ncbi:MAG: ParB/RepB/Spo0J family partition protein [Bacillota bacterium]
MPKKISKGLSKILANIEDARVAVQPSEVVEGENIYNIDINTITANPEQPRKYFGEEQQMELVESIKIHGIIQPLILVKDGDGYMIVAGERRYRAAKLAGMSTVPAILKQLSGQQLREISLIENLQRENLNAIEEAEAVKELAEMYNLTQDEVSHRIGKARSSVANIMRLLTLDKEVQMLVRQERLSAGHARALIGVSEAEVQVEFAFAACDGQMTVRELEQKVRFYLHPELAPKKMSAETKANISLEMRNLVDDMKRIFSTKVKAVGNENKGRIYIDYFTNDDLQRIFDLMEKLK